MKESFGGSLRTRWDRKGHKSTVRRQSTRCGAPPRQSPACRSATLGSRIRAPVASMHVRVAPRVLRAGWRQCPCMWDHDGQSRHEEARAAPAGDERCPAACSARLSGTPSREQTPGMRFPRRTGEGILVIEWRVAVSGHAGSAGKYTVGTVGTAPASVPLAATHSRHRHPARRWMGRCPG